MMKMDAKRLPGSLRLLCEAAPEYGVDAEQILANTGIVVFDLYDANASVTLAQEITAIKNFVRLAPKTPGIGIKIGRRYRPQVFGIWGYAIMSSPSIRAGLQIATEYANLSFIIAGARLVEDVDPALLIFSPHLLPQDIQCFVLQRHLTVLSNFIVELLPGIRLSQFTFETTLAGSAEIDAIEQELGMEVIANSNRNAIVLPRRILDLPLPKHKPEVMEDCLRQCRVLIGSSHPGQNKWSDKIRELAMMDIGEHPTISDAARKLGVTERTLRRRLSEEGTSFRNILAEARLSLGHELLSTAKLDVSTVAFRTGYSESSSFVRAFAQHFGYTPGQLKSGKVPVGGAHEQRESL